MEIMQKNEIIRAILSMPPMDRMEIVDKVLEGLGSKNESDYESLWSEEAERRLDAFIGGSIKTIPAEEVFGKINDLK